MPSTHVSLHSHLVFSTKDRAHLIGPEWRVRLHAYLGGIARGLSAMPLVIGGTSDHVHLLIGFKSIHRLDYFLRDLKADSSEWVHKEIGKRLFALAERIWRVLRESGKPGESQKIRDEPGKSS